jgi:hypothetical protein
MARWQEGFKKRSAPDAALRRSSPWKQAHATAFTGFFPDTEGGPVWAWLKSRLKTGILKLETPESF